MTLSPRLISALVSSALIFSSVEASAKFSAELGVTTAKRAGGDALVLSPTFGVDYRLTSSVKLGADFGLTSVRAEGIETFQPSNFQLSLMDNDEDFFYGIKAAVSFAAVANGREQNLRAGLIRGGWNAWLYTPKTSAVVASAGYRGQLIDDFLESVLNLDMATLIASDGEPLRAAWQFAWDLRIPMFDEAFTLAARTALVRPTDRFFGNRSGTALFFEPSAQIKVGPVKVWAAINLPAFSKMPTGIEDNLSTSFLFGLELFNSR